MRADSTLVGLHDAIQIAFGWPVSRWRFPMLLWLAARALWNSVMVGSSRASRSRIARACSWDLSAAPG
jgi:hypothetical protein